jgi:hypothetical protein
MRLAFAACILLSLPALAAPPASQPSPDVKTKYQPALSRGRKLQGKHDWKGAIAAFQECLVVLPDDPIALSEIGWSAFNLPDLALAEKSTRAALRAGGSPDLRGATFYNLGLIEEARGDKVAAIAAYKESLKARQHEVVRAALGKLDPAAAKELDPFKPLPMDGPYKYLETYCKEKHPNSKTPATDDDPGETCTCSAEPIDTGRLDKPKAPILEGRIIAEGCSSGEGSYENAPQTLHLAVRVKKGWYVSDLFNTRDDHYCSDDIKPPEFSVVDGAAVLRIRVEEGCARSLMNETTQERFYVAGVGPSGAPSVTPEVLTIDEFSEMPRNAEGDLDWDAPEYKTVRDVKRAASFAAGKLVIGGSKKSPGAEHELVFP